MHVLRIYAGFLNIVTLLPLFLFYHFIFYNFFCLSEQFIEREHAKFKHGEFSFSLYQQSLPLAEDKNKTVTFAFTANNEFSKACSFNENYDTIKIKRKYVK